MSTIYKVVFFGMLAFTVGCAEVQKKHPNITQHLQKIDTVVIAPPTVSIQYLTFTGENEALTDIEESIRDQLMVEADKELRRRDYKVVFYDFDTALDLDEEFAYTLTELRENFVQAKPDFVKGKMLTGESKRFRENLARSANVIADAAGADALLLLTYNGYRKSEGLIAKDIATSVILAAFTGSVAVTPMEGATLEVALVDGASGDILFTDSSFGPTLSDVKVLVKSIGGLPHDVKAIGENREEEHLDTDNLKVHDSKINGAFKKTVQIADPHSE